MKRYVRVQEMSGNRSEARKTKCVFTLATAFFLASSVANAQKLTVWGLEGFNVQPGTHTPHPAPAWVQPYYGSIGSAYPLGTFENDFITVNRSGEEETTWGPFGTFSSYSPFTGGAIAPAYTGSTTITSSGVKIANYGTWLNTLYPPSGGSVPILVIWGGYFAGMPATYTKWSTNAVDGIYTGKVIGIPRLGYKVAPAGSEAGVVTITINYPSVSISFRLASSVTGRSITCNGRGTVNPQGVDFNCSGTGTEWVYDSYYHATTETFTVGGGGRSLFFGTDAPAITGLLWAANTSGVKNTGVTFAVAFGACKTSAASCTAQ